MKTKGLSDLDTKGYYNKTIHACVLKLHLPLAIINDIYKNLYHKNEVSGVFYVDENDKVSHADKNEGDAESVFTPNNIINYHTHPIHAYRNGKTCYGCPSGEDYRECMKFALAGNKAHLVFTVEGLYTIQLSPCKIKKILELLDDNERGILIFLIEEYFKSNHDFRCTEELNTLSTSNIIVNPYSFVDFANTFDIYNVLTDKKGVFKEPHTVPISEIGHTGIHKNPKYTNGEISGSFSKIPNMGFPVITDNYITTMPMKSFLSDEDLDNLRKINTFGKEIDSDKTTLTRLNQQIRQIAKKLDSVPCKIEWNSNPNAWFFVNFFPTVHYTNQLHMKNKKHIMPNMDNKGMYLLHEPFIRIFSNSGTGCKVKDMEKTHNFNMDKKFTYSSPSKRQSTFGNLKLDSLDTEIHYLSI